MTRPNGKISGDPVATTTVGLAIAAAQNGGNVQVPNSLFQLPAIFASLATARDKVEGIEAGIKGLLSQFYSPTYTSPSTFVGRANYARISKADIDSAAYPALSYFRSTDRIMPNGTTDATNGGYWIITELTPTPDMFGAKGDGTTDDSAAIQACIDFLARRGGGDLLWPGRIYYTGTTTITLPVKVGIKSQFGSELKYDGTGVALDVFGSSSFNYSGRALDLPIVTMGRGVQWDVLVLGVSQDTTTVGVQLNACHHERITFPLIRNFRRGLMMRAIANTAPDRAGSGNCIYNTISFGKILNCWHSIEMIDFAASPPYDAAGTNSNNFFGGLCRVDSGLTHEAGSCYIYLPNANTNTNTFVGVGLERGGNAKGIYDNGIANMYVNCRFEQGTPAGYIELGANSEDIKIFGRSPQGVAGNGNFNAAVTDSGFGNMFWWSKSISSKGITWNSETGKLYFGPGSAAPSVPINGLTGARVELGDTSTGGFMYHGLMHQAAVVQTTGVTTTAQNHITFNYAAPATMLRALGVSNLYDGLVTFFDLNGNITLTHTAAPASQLGQFVLTAGVNLLMTAKVPVLFRAWDGNYYQI